MHVQHVPDVEDEQPIPMEALFSEAPFQESITGKNICICALIFKALHTEEESQPKPVFSKSPRLNYNRYEIKRAAFYSSTKIIINLSPFNPHKGNFWRNFTCAK